MIWTVYLVVLTKFISTESEFPHRHQISTSSAM